MDADGIDHAPEGGNVAMDTDNQTHGDSSASVASHDTAGDPTGATSNNDVVDNDKTRSDTSGAVGTGNIGVTTEEGSMEVDDNKEKEDIDHQSDQDSGLEKKNSGQNVVNEQQSQSQLDHSDSKKVVKDDHENSQVDDDDQDKSQVDESKVLEGDQKSPESDQELEGIKKNTQNGQGKDDQADNQMEVDSKQDDQSKNKENANSDQEKIKTDEDGPSTPPYTTNSNTDSQATEIIDSQGSQGDSQGSNEYHTPPDQSNGSSDVAHSSEDEKETQYGRPWYKFWGSDDRPGKKRKIKITRKPSVWSARDTVAYRKHYPGKKDNKNITKNLKFYRNEISSYPHGDYIDVIHKKWWGKHDHLEYNHSYIQWLFPIRERGLNMYADELQLHEAEAICSDPVAHGRLLKSYKMMLDFYGLEMTDEKTGALGRAKNWEERFRHLNHSMHNYLRITRILKCLGEMKLEHLKAPFVRYVLYEIISEQTLYNCLDSCINYWLQVVRSDEEREDLLEYAESLAKETQTTTVTTEKRQAEDKAIKKTESKDEKGQAEGETKKKIESKDESQSKKETQSKKTQSTKGKQQKDESQSQSEKQSQSKKKQNKSKKK